MPIIACGINHKTAPVALREKVVFLQEKLGLYLQDLVANENVKEAVLLSTCNRSELYCQAEDANQLMDWFCRQHAVSKEALEQSWYCYYDQEAMEHIMRVACGLDSMILGEPQILGQMKDAFSESCAAAAIGPQFNRLFQQVFSVAKDIRTNTSIGACPVSIASAALKLAKTVVEKPLEETRILLIGAGDTVQLILRHLENQKIKELVIANRNQENAAALASKYAAKPITISRLAQALKNTDIVISATGSPVPLVTKEMLVDCKQALVIIDIAVPRDVEANVAELPNINLYSVDDLKNVIQHNLRGREHAAEKALEVIKKRSAEFIAWLQSLDQVAKTIKAYRKQIENLCDEELSKAFRQIQRGNDPVQVLASFAHALTNKLLHNPSVQLRQAGAEGRFELLELAQELFAIPKPEVL